MTMNAKVFRPNTQHFPERVRMRVMAGDAGYFTGCERERLDSHGGDDIDLVFRRLLSIRMALQTQV